MSLMQAGIRTFRAFVSYDGSEFSGFQEQPGQPTIQEALRKAIEIICKGTYKLKFAGRTDAGVHARNQVISIEMYTDLDLRKLVLALSHGLPRSVRVTRADEFPYGFDPKRHAVGKRYVYRIWNALTSNPFNDKFTWHVRRPIDPYLMQKAANFLVGEHDFESFRSSGCAAAHAKRFIWGISISKNEHLIEIDIRGNAFCQNMVRIIAGTLVEVGTHKKAPDEVQMILNAKNRCIAGITAPAKGLTLEQVYYPDNLIDAQIPSEARFPRFPVTTESWPFRNDQITIGITNNH